jgi:hypothetical protein
MRSPPHRYGRGGRFANYLANLSPQERRRIEYAERLFLAKRNAPFSPQVRVARDFNAAMVGVREEFDTQ